jgi:hypothetical protein
MSPGAVPELPGAVPELPGAVPELPGAPPVSPGAVPELPGAPPVSPGAVPELPGRFVAHGINSTLLGSLGSPFNSATSQHRLLVRASVGNTN